MTYEKYTVTTDRGDYKIIEISTLGEDIVIMFSKEHTITAGDDTIRFSIPKKNAVELGKALVKIMS